MQFLSRNFVATQIAREIAQCNISHNHQVSQHFCCSKRCTKQNQVLLFATIAVTLQRIFEAWHSVTPLLQLVSQCFVRSANNNTPFKPFQSSSVTFARQVARNIAQCNTTDRATAMQEIQPLRDKLHEKLHSVSFMHAVIYQTST